MNKRLLVMQLILRKKIYSEIEFDDLNVNQDNIDKSDIKSTYVRSPIHTRSQSGYVAKHPTRYNE